MIPQPMKLNHLDILNQKLYILPHLFADPLEGVWYSMPISDAAATLLSAYLLIAEVRRLRRATDGTPLKHS